MRRYLLVALLFGNLLIMPALSQAAEEGNSFIGVITESKESPKWMGAQVTFTGLASSHPTVVWPDGNDEGLSIIFRNENLVVIQFVSAVGSTDTVYIDKRNKQFLVTSVAALRIVVERDSMNMGVYRGYIK